MQIGEENKALIENFSIALRREGATKTTITWYLKIFNPDISILSEDFLAEVRELPQKNLAYEVLKKLLDHEIKTRSRRNLIQGKSFAEMLERAINEYKNRVIDTVQVIEAP